MNNYSDMEQSNLESFKVTGDELLSKIKEILKEGKAKKVIIQNQNGEVIKEFSLKAGLIGAVLVPQIAAIGAITAMSKNWTIIVEKNELPDK